MFPPITANVRHRNVSIYRRYISTHPHFKYWAGIQPYHKGWWGVLAVDNFQNQPSNVFAKKLEWFQGFVRRGESFQTYLNKQVALDLHQNKQSIPWNYSLRCQKMRQNNVFTMVIVFVELQMRSVYIPQVSVTNIFHSVDIITLCLDYTAWPPLSKTNIYPFNNSSRDTRT